MDTSEVLEEPIEDVRKRRGSSKEMTTSSHSSQSDPIDDRYHIHFPDANSVNTALTQ